MWWCRLECIVGDVGFTSSEGLPLGIGDLSDRAHGGLWWLEDSFPSSSCLWTWWWCAGHSKEPGGLQGVESCVGRTRGCNLLLGFRNSVCSSGIYAMPVIRYGAVGFEKTLRFSRNLSDSFMLLCAVVVVPVRFLQRIYPIPSESIRFRLFA